MTPQKPYSQVNKSLAKAMYSFGKSQRPSPAKKVYCHSFYNPPQTKSHREASIGYGKKVSLADLTISQLRIPSPGTYNLPDFAFINKSHQKGFTLGIGRQETKNQSFIQFDKFVPGPQRYQPQLKKQAPRYSLRKRFASQAFVKSSSKFVPGPGAYDPLTNLNPQGTYWISKWSSSKAKRFDPISSSRFPTTKIKAPGPDKYTPRNSTWIDNGRMTQSKYMSCGSRAFGTGNRSTIFDEAQKKMKDIPGPGMYQSFSDFGSIQSIDWSTKKKIRSLRPSTSDAYKR